MTHPTTMTILKLVCRLIRAGWEVSHIEQMEAYRWRRPDGISGSEYYSSELLTLPYRVLLDVCLEGK